MPYVASSVCNVNTYLTKFARKVSVPSAAGLVDFIAPYYIPKRLSRRDQRVKGASVKPLNVVRKVCSGNVGSAPGPKLGQWERVLIRQRRRSFNIEPISDRPTRSVKSKFWSCGSPTTNAKTPIPQVFHLLRAVLLDVQLS